MNQNLGQPPAPAPRVRSTPILLAPFAMIGREIRGLFSVPSAMVGGLLGTIVLSAGMLALLLFPGSSNADDAVAEDEFLLEFEPGALTKLGVEPKEIPEKPIHEEMRTPDEAVEEAVTEDEKPPEQEIEKKDEQEVKKDDQPKNQNPDAKVGPKNTKDNNPYDDVPNDAEITGDPFGDPNGWADMAKDGDPWATSVMAALNGMKVPAWAGKIPHSKPYKFTMQICKDGTVKNVFNKASTGNTDLDGAVRTEVMRLKIPKPPANILAKMPATCVTLKYTFSWQAGKVK